METGPGVPLENLGRTTNVLVTVDPAVDAREVFLDSITVGDTEEGVTIVLATAESGEALFADFERTPDPKHSDGLQIIDGTIQRPDTTEPSEVQYVPPVSEYLTELGDQFGRTLDDLADEFDRQGDALSNQVGFYSLGPLLELAEDTELVFRFLCVLINQIEAAGGQGVFVIDASYERAVSHLEVLFDKRADVGLDTDGSHQRELIRPI